MSTETILEEARAGMQKALNRSLSECAGMHTGRASPSMVENLKVELYETTMRLQEAAAITTPEARTIAVQPWDKSTIGAIETALQKANLGFHPAIQGDKILCPLPELSGERRTELIKACQQISEQARVGVRAARRAALNAVQKFQKDKTLSEDEAKTIEKTIQTHTDDFIQKIDHHLQNKEKELNQC